MLHANAGLIDNGDWLVGGAHNTDWLLSVNWPGEIYITVLTKSELGKPVLEKLVFAMYQNIFC